MIISEDNLMRMLCDAFWAGFDTGDLKESDAEERRKWNGFSGFDEWYNKFKEDGYKSSKEEA